ncbi:MAG TPA: nuclear transport factor 2 family protein [Pyrinomonadaceae bacterium]|jgi:ketosteroid isomerase-like protein|nr:nuclear transport factor 2 family protein [Pyrinomonadaceae bacterium]
MRNIRTHLLTFFAAALTLAALSVSPLSAAAQDKGKETQKPATGTVDAWRQALPPEAETPEPTEAPAAVTQPRLTREAVEKSLLALERKWMDSLQQRDASVLSQLISDDFTLVSPRLVVASGDRDKYFQHAMRELNLTSYDFEGLSVRLYGRTAVVSGRLRQSANAAGEDWGGNYLFTDVWVSRDGAWQVVSRHASPLPPEKK